MITQKLTEDITAILEQNQAEVDAQVVEGVRSAAIGVLGLGLGAVGAYNMAHKEQPKPSPLVQPDKTTKPEVVAPQAIEQPKKNNITKVKKAIENLSDMEKYFAMKALEHGIEGVELIAFIAQVAHETNDFSTLIEQGTKKYFRRYEPKSNPRTAKILGNVKNGDGEKYKGRGFVQLTGRYNYKHAGKALGLPLEDKPQLLENPSVSFKVAMWYWNTRVKSKIEDFEDVVTVTKLINGGTNGLKDRKEKFEKYLALLSDN